MNAKTFLIGLLVVTTLVSNTFAQAPKPIGRGAEFLTALPPPPGRRPAALASIVRRTPPPSPIAAAVMPQPTPLQVPDIMEAEITTVPVKPTVAPTKPPKRRRRKRFGFFFSHGRYYRYRIYPWNMLTFSMEEHHVHESWAINLISALNALKSYSRINTCASTLNVYGVSQYPVKIKIVCLFQVYQT